MKRRLTIFFSVVLVLVLVAVPCLAETVDVLDYEYKVDFSEDYSLVYLSIPASSFENGQIRLWENDLVTLLGNSYGDRFVFSAVADKYYGLSYVPTRMNKISVLDIPNGTQISIRALFGVNASHSTNATARLTIDYYDRDGNSLGNQVVAFGSRPLTEPLFTFTMQKPDDAYTMGLTLVMRDVQFLNNVYVTFTVESIDMVISYDSLVYEQLQSGRTNKLLGQIQDKLDGITDYIPQPSDPSGGLGDAFDDAEQEVIDKVETGRDRIDDIIDEFTVYLEEFLPGIVAFSNWLSVLLELKFIRVLLFFSLAFGMCGLFLGVANSFRGKS